MRVEAPSSNTVEPPSAGPTPAPAPVPAPAPAPAASPPPAASGTATSNQAPTLAAINSGGSRFFAGTTLNFSDDQYFVGGNTAQSTTTIAGTSAAPIYLTERWGQFAYVIPLADGDYQVTLHQAEIYSGITGPSQRVFDVVMERSEPGEMTIRNVDIWSAVGPNAVYDIVRDVRVSNGALNIEFVRKVQEAKVSGISVRPISQRDPIRSGKVLIAETLARLQGIANVGTTIPGAYCSGPQVFQVTDSEIVFGSTRLRLADVLAMKVVSNYYDDGLSVTLDVRADGSLDPVKVSFLIASTGALMRAGINSSGCGTLNATARWGTFDGAHHDFIANVHPLASSYRPVRLACDYAANFSGDRAAFKSVYEVAFTNGVLDFGNLGSGSGNYPGNLTKSGLLPPSGPVHSVYVSAADDLVQHFTYDGNITTSSSSVTMDTAGVVRGASATGRPGHGADIACGLPLVYPY